MQSNWITEPHLEDFKVSRVKLLIFTCQEPDLAVGQKKVPPKKPGKWKHGPKPAVFDGLILTHIHLVLGVGVLG